MSDSGAFSYSLRSVHVVFGEGALDDLDRALDATPPASRLMLVSTPGRAAELERVQAALEDRIVSQFSGAKLHVPVTVVAEAMRTVGATRPDCIVALGGGSAIGVGKALVRETGLPLVAVPTTYSGSEMTDIWGVSEGGRKVTGRDARVAPRLVAYDPELTHSLPLRVTGPSGMNAIAHGVEALYSETGSPLASLLAADGIRRLAASLPAIVADPPSPAARREALLGAHLCGRALDLASMGLHHKLCHALGGILDLPHALTHAVVLPHVAAYNAAAAPLAMKVVATGLGVPDAPQGLWDLNRALGIMETLTDLGMTAGDVEAVVGEVMARSYANPAPVTEQGVREILRHAMGSGPPGVTPSGTARSP